MPKAFNQRAKLFLLLDYLKRRSDEEHPVTLQAMENMLAANGISVERKTLYTDLETLRELGYDVVSIKGRGTGYYLGKREYELTELKLLADAVEVSRFITEKKSDELLRKLSRELSDYDAASLRRQLYNRGRIKTMNERIYYNVDALHTAIGKDKMVRFHYFYWNEKKGKVLRRDGAYYRVSPFFLSWDNENYYLVAYDRETAAIRHFRVDKMLDLAVLKTEREGKEALSTLDPTAYKSFVFGMFGGREEDVNLRVKNSLAGVVIDRFGKDVTLLPDGEGYFRVNVRVAVSPTFLSWVLGFGSDVRILSPSSVVEELKALAESVLLAYR